MSDNHIQTISAIQVQTIRLGPSSGFPNNTRLLLLIYREAFDKTVEAEEIMRTFKRNDWSGGWQNSIYSFDHYHSITHEVLGICAGEAKVQLGGPDGPVEMVSQGDVIVIPAGVSHKRIESTKHFEVVGAYPGGMPWDMNYGNPEEYPQVEENISRVPLPQTDPIYGTDGPLQQRWRE